MTNSLLGNFPGGHITVLLDKLETARARDWYAAATVEHGWSRNVLSNMIMGQAMERTGSAPSNFAELLPSPDSELAQQAAKEPYNLEFLGLSGEVAERDLEQKLTDQIVEQKLTDQIVEQKLTDQIVETLRELGPGLAFVGR